MGQRSDNSDRAKLSRNLLFDILQWKQQKAKITNYLFLYHFILFPSIA